MNELEKAFINNFVKKQYQERLLFEFNSDKKRENALDRFSHNIEDIVRADRIILSGTKISKPDIERELKLKKINALAYVISSRYIQGQFFDVQEALSFCEDECMPVIIIFSEKMAFIKAEVEYGAPMKMLLWNELKS